MRIQQATPSSCTGAHCSHASQVKEKVKSMLAAKSFDAATSDVAAIKRWFRVLGEELCDRMLNDFAEHHRHPRTLSLSYR